MRNDFTLGIQGTVEPNITFLLNSNKEAMRIDKNGVKVNPDFPMDEAAKYVIKALDEHIKVLVQTEREACAKVCDAVAQQMDDEGEGPTGNIGWVIGCADAIRARNKQ